MGKSTFFWLDVTDWNQRDKLLSVRIPVFVDEQKVPIEEEIDTFDEVSTHVLISTADGVPVATGRLKPNGWIGRMAVLKAYRSFGFGSAIIKKLLHIAHQKGMTEVWLSAQTHAVPFYGKHGFKVKGDVYDDAGIPHVDMYLNLK